jgi:hypothetical protein
VTHLDHPLVRSLGPVADRIGADFVPPEEIVPGDVALEWEGAVVAGMRLRDLHDALDRMIRGVEQECGGPLAELPRERKQAAVRLLHERGAFLLRRGVEDVAEAMGVSRITIYNYLNAIEG